MGIRGHEAVATMAKHFEEKLDNICCHVYSLLVSTLKMLDKKRKKCFRAFRVYPIVNLYSFKEIPLYAKQWRNKLMPILKKGANHA